MSTLGVTTPCALVSALKQQFTGQAAASRAQAGLNTMVSAERVISHNPLRKLAPAVALGAMEEDMKEEFGWRAGALKTFATSAAQH